MDKVENLALQVTKEIVVKFVETGRISPTNFSQYFGMIYESVLQVISKGGPTETATPKLEELHD